MFYKFDINGIYIGTSKTEVPYSTSVAPLDENETATWIWNHVSWIAKPVGWKYPEPQAGPIPVEEVVEEVVEETPATETPTTS